MHPARDSYHHGDLRRALVEAGLELCRMGGADAVVLREATRRTGVTARAAYRHFADREALVRAVAQAALAEMAATIANAQAGVTDPVELLRRVGLGYLRFAWTEPGWFDAAFFAMGEPVGAPDRGPGATVRGDGVERGGRGDEGGRGGRDDGGSLGRRDDGGSRARRGDQAVRSDRGGRDDRGGRRAGVGPRERGGRATLDASPFRLLQTALAGLVAAGLLRPDRTEAAALLCWSGVHGFATLSARGPLASLPRQIIEVRGNRLVDDLVAAVITG